MYIHVHVHSTCPHPSLRQVWEGGLAGEPVRDNAGPRVLRAGQQGQPEVRGGGRERERERESGLDSPSSLSTCTCTCM